MPPNPLFQDARRDQFFAPARRRPQLWRLLLGVGVILFVYMGTFAMMSVAMYAIVGPLRYFGWMSGLIVPDQPGQVIFILLSFAGMMIGAFLAAGACHRRAPVTLFGPVHRVVTGFLKTLLVLIPIYLGLAAYFVLQTPTTANLPLGQWLAYLPLAIPLVLLQVTAEEVIFRGYLPQQLAARFKARWVWALLPAVIFTLLHYDGRAGIGSLSVLLTIFVFAIIAMDLTERTGSLGPAIALHLVNNCVALLVLAVPGTITGLALFTAPFDITNPAEVAKAALMDLALLYLVWRLLKRSVSA